MKTQTLRYSLFTAVDLRHFQELFALGAPRKTNDTSLELFTLLTHPLVGEHLAKEGIVQTHELSHKESLHLTDDNNQNTAHIITVKQGAHATITYHVSKTKEFLSTLIYLHIEQDANVTFCELQELPLSATYHAATLVSLKENAKLFLTEAAIGAGNAITQTVVNLEERGASVHLSHFASLKENQLLAVDQQANHLAPETTSHLIEKNALTNEATLTMRTLIDIKKNATNSQGRQRADTILLSPRAQANTVPELEIATPEVSCSHAATTKRLSADELYYLMTRGLTKAEAKNLLLAWFFSASAKNCEDEQFAKTLHEALLATVSQKDL
ncbi:MAG: SufD family Fe-S cluster assembly protein [Candidatus Woesearchaeota archaeon]|nr:MAG: SufD family Fe-S cluster assembly protein [Candidatus Woesearchaeota archaeon]